MVDSIRAAAQSLTRGGGGDPVSHPVRPLDDHLIPQFGDDTAGGEQRGLRSTHCRPPLKKVGPI